MRVRHVKFQSEGNLDIQMIMPEKADYERIYGEVINDAKADRTILSNLIEQLRPLSRPVI